MSKAELKEYNKWFHGILPQRIDELTSAVRDSPEFEYWKADLSPDSLVTLGKWLARAVDKRARTTRELEEIAARSPYPIQIPDWELTNQTFSLAIDVGMYFSQVLLHNHAALRWEQPLGSKKFIDYGQLVLSGFGQMFFNPVQLMVTLAYGLATKKLKGERLRDLYDTWSEMTREVVHTRN